jgi:hypothetical protein
VSVDGVGKPLTNDINMSKRLHPTIKVPNPDKRTSGFGTKIFRQDRER